MFSSRRWIGGILAFLLLPFVPFTLTGQEQRGGREPPDAKQPPINDKRQIEDKAQIAAAVDLMADSVALFNKGQFAAAEVVARKALERMRTLRGEIHPDVANCYFNLASIMRQQYQPKAAAEYSSKALEIRRKVLGEEHLDTARSYYNLAVDLHALTQYAQAEQMDRKGLEIRRKLLGEENPTTAMSYSNLASDLQHQGKFAAAEELDRKVLETRRKLHGEFHSETANSYNNLAADLNGLGQYAVAEQMDRKALEIRVKIGGDESPGAVQSYNNLAGSLNLQGQYAAAEQLHRKVLEISRKHTGDGSLGSAQCRHNLAGDLHQQGQFAASEQMNRQALAVFRKLLGDEHPETLRSFNSLASDLGALGQHAAAEELHRKVVESRRKVFGENHPDTARAYSTLAGDLHSQGKHAAAAELFRKALEISRKTMGEIHPLTATFSSGLGVELAQTGQFAAAEKYHRQALEIDRKVLGEEHPSTALSYQLLAFSLYGQGDYQGAERIGLEAARSFQAARLRISYTGLGRSIFGVRQSPLRPLTVVLARNNKPAEAWKFFEEDLGRGLLDDLASRSMCNLTPQERQQEESLQGKLANIEKLLGADRKIDPKELADLQSQRERLMNGLLQLQADMEKKYSVAAGQVYGLSKIQASLPADTAVVTWVDIGFGVGAKDPSGDHWGVVVRSKGDPVWVKLKGTGPEGSWQPSDYELLDKLRGVLQFPDPNTDWKSWRDDVVKQRIRPLSEHLDGVTQLIILPSEHMAGIPIEALTERYKISYSPSGTMFAWLQEHRKDFAKGNGTLLALADPVFSKEQAQLSLPAKEAQRHLVRGVLKPLPGTRGEANAIAKLFGQGNVQLLAGIDANGVNLDRLAESKKLAQFRYLHLATHGFADPKGGLNSFLALAPENLKMPSHDRLSAAHMLRTWHLDADLVTLSACTTALGEYQGGEGYVGFSQALFLAGAHTVVVSQWPVHDLSTTLLMERFYQNLLGARPGLKNPLAKVEALTEARRWLKGLTRTEAIGRLKELAIAVNESELLGERPFEHPYFWAPFILVGDPGRTGS